MDAYDSFDDPGNNIRNISPSDACALNEKSWLIKLPNELATTYEDAMGNVS